MSTYTKAVLINLIQRLTKILGTLPEESNKDKWISTIVELLIAEEQLDNFVEWIRSQYGSEAIKVEDKE